MTGTPGSSCWLDLALFCNFVFLRKCYWFQLICGKTNPEGEDFSLLTFIYRTRKKYFGLFMVCTQFLEKNDKDMVTMLDERTIEGNGQNLLLSSSNMAAM